MNIQESNVNNLYCMLYIITSSKFENLSIPCMTKIFVALQKETFFWNI